MIGTLKPYSSRCAEKFPPNYVFLCPSCHKYQHVSNGLCNGCSANLMELGHHGAVNLRRKHY